MSNLLDPKDIPKLIPLAHAFIEESGEDIPFDPEHFVKTWGHIYATQTGSIIGYKKNDKIIGALG